MECLHFTHRTAVARQPEKTMLQNYHTQFKLAALTFSVLMTLAVNGYLLVQFDSLAQGATAQITLPTVTIIGRSA
jgi:hypothetical protein